MARQTTLRNNALHKAYHVSFILDDLGSDGCPNLACGSTSHPTAAAVKDDATRFPRCWPSPPPPRCAARAPIKPWPNGLKTSPNALASASAATTATATMTCPATGDWCVEAAHHILDNAFDEDRCRIRTGHDPENTTRLRRFAIGLIRSHSQSVASALRKLQRNTRLVFDYLKMTRNTPRPQNHVSLGGRTN